MIRISYSTLNQVRQCRQWWVCKISGLSKVDFPWFTSGKEAHNIIQAHISGKSSLLHPELAEKLDGLYFPVVEEKDFDERTGFEIVFGDYLMRGFLDGFDKENGRAVEIKTSSQPWTLKQFHEAIQKDIYALAFDWIKESYLINCTKDLTNVRTFKVPITQKNRDRASKWIKEGIDIIEGGDFEGGECVNCRMCIYQNSCPKSQYRG